MARKSGYPCPHCGKIAYVGRFPHVCPYCNGAYESSKPKFYDEPYPEIDPDFQPAKPVEEIQPEPEPEPIPVEKEAEEEFEKFCLNCEKPYPMATRRCPICHRPMSVRPKAAPIAAPKAEAPKKAPRLKCEYEGKVFYLDLSEEQQIIGRLSMPEFPAGVSRRHVALFLENGKVMIMDCGSTNGTYIDNILLAKQTPHELKELEKGFAFLRLGHHVTVRISLCA